MLYIYNNMIMYGKYFTASRAVFSGCLQTGGALLCLELSALLRLRGCAAQFNDLR